MKFHLAVNLERVTPDLDMREVERHTLEMVQRASAAASTSLGPPSTTRWR